MVPARCARSGRSAAYEQLGEVEPADSQGLLELNSDYREGYGRTLRTGRGRTACLARGACCAGLLAAAACAAYLGGRSQRLRAMPAGDLQLKEDTKEEATWKQDFPSLCGKTEVDVEYEAEEDSWGTNFDHIPTPEMCCAMCQGEPKCTSFTWVKDAGLKGCKSQCWLKGGKVVKSKKKVGVVSGKPPPRPILPLVPTGKKGPGGSLYCFALMVPHGYEPSMIRWQHAHKASIFACDAFGIYSSKKLRVAPGVVTWVVDSDLKCEYGGDSGTALNAWIFIAVWQKVISVAEYKAHDWVVKVDPDAVFFPDRLGRILAHYEKDGYINNCKFGMHGPIEVLSTKAVNKLGADYNRSEDKKAPKLCVTKQHFGLWGEDMFLDQCLGKILEVKPRPLNPLVMCEAHCVCPAWYWCQNSTETVSYHPFKSPEAYEVCMANALGGKVGKPTPLPDELKHPTPLTLLGGKDGKDQVIEEDDKKQAAKDRKAEEEAAKTFDYGGKCQDSEPGTPCFKAVRWAKEHGIYEHEEWYEGLSSDSTYADFQLWLNQRNKSMCVKPCEETSEVSNTTDSNHSKGSKDSNSSSDDDSGPPPGPRAQTFYMYRAGSKASYPLENTNTADLAGVMWYLHNEVVRNTPRKYAIDRIRRFKVTVKNTWEFWNAHKRQFGAFVAYDAARCSTPVCKKIYHHYGFIVGCQVCDTKVAAYLAKDQTNWNCKKGEDQCRAPLWYSLPGPCPAMGLANEDIAANKDGGLDVMSAKSKDCLKRMPGGHCDKATGAPDCTYSYEEAGEIFLNELSGIDGDYNDFWNTSFTRCANDVANGRLPKDHKCVHQKEYEPHLDKGIGCSFWDGVHDAEKGTARMEAVRKLFKKHYPDFPLSLPEPPCEFDMYYDGEWDWKINHKGANKSDWWDQRM